MTSTAAAKPAWAGDDWLSKGVNLLIRTRPLYALMKRQARQVLIKTAERNGIPWRETVAHWEASGVSSRLSTVADPSVSYPDYYRVPFHAYDAGNLCWLAAFEASSATYAMALRVWPQETLSWQAAHDRLRATFHQALEEYGLPTVRDVLDIGCSVGLSTLALHHYLQRQQSTRVRSLGLDLSPYMLAIAQAQDSRQEITQWIHAPAEKTGLPDASTDLITLQFVTHELPHQASLAIFREALRLLRPGGILAIADNNPASPVIQSLPPVLFTLMKSTEPWSDDYYTFDIEAGLSEVGFEATWSTPTDPRHRAILARKPYS